MSARWSLALATEPNIVFVDDVRATQGGSATTLNDGEWFWLSSVLYYRSDAGNPDTLGLVIEAGQRDYCFDSNTKDGLTIENLTARRANSMETDNGCLYFHYQPTGCTVSNVTVTEGAYFGIHTNGAVTDLTLDHVTATACGSNGVHFNAVMPVENTGISVQHCTVSGNGWRTGLAAGLLGGMQAEIFDGDVGYSTFDGNGIAGVPANVTEHGLYLFQAAGGSCAVHDCTFSNNVAGAGLKSRAPVIVHGNIFTGNREGIEFGANDTDDITLVAHHNLYYENDILGLVAQTKGAGTMDVTVEQETFYHNGSSSNQDLKISADLTTLTVKNCALWSSPTCDTMVIVTQTGTVDIDYNLHWRDDSAPVIHYNATDYDLAGWQGLGHDAHGLGADPLFTNAGAADFTLQAGSPCIDAGVVIAGINDGYSGSAPDIGAFEFVPAVVVFGGGLVGQFVSDFAGSFQAVGLFDFGLEGGGEGAPPVVVEVTGTTRRGRRSSFWRRAKRRR